MVYVDQSGSLLDGIDLSAGYLVDKEWIDHPARKRKGHFAYTRNKHGGVVQTYVVDQEARGAYREVTVQMFIPYDKPAPRASASPRDVYVLKGV